MSVCKAINYTPGRPEAGRQTKPGLSQRLLAPSTLIHFHRAFNSSEFNTFFFSRRRVAVSLKWNSSAPRSPQPDTTVLDTVCLGPGVQLNRGPLGGVLFPPRLGRWHCFRTQFSLWSGVGGGGRGRERGMEMMARADAEALFVPGDPRRQPRLPPPPPPHIF